MPVIPRDVVHARLVFDLNPTGSAPEQAVMGFHMQRLHEPGDPTGWQTDTQEIADKIADKWKTNLVSAVAMWANTIKLNRVEAYHLNSADGKTLHKGVTPATGARAWAGTSTTGSLPYEVSCAVSLYGYIPGTFDRDAKIKRGRFYLPPFQSGIMAGSTNDGLFEASNLTTVRTAIKAFLNDVHYLEVGNTPGGLGDDAMLVGVLSRTRNAFAPLQVMRMGRVPDSQRRRRRSQSEAYVDEAIAQS